MAKFLDILYLYFLKMFQWIKIRFCVSNQKFVPSFFKVYPNRFYISSFLHTFLRKIPWKLYDPFITFKLQVWRMNYLHISKSFSVCLWNIFENITGMPLRGHLLAARSYMFIGWVCVLWIPWHLLGKIIAYSTYKNSRTNQAQRIL